MRSDVLPPRVGRARGEGRHICGVEGRVIREPKDVEADENVPVPPKGVEAVEHYQERGQEDMLEVPILRGGAVARHNRRVGRQVQLRKRRL
eukprot:scaffold59039_cov29-Tisochrysis_lutea.AAC.4